VRSWRETEVFFMFMLGGKTQAMTRIDIMARAASSPLRVSWTEADGYRITHPQFTIECLDAEHCRAVYRELRRNWLAMFREAA
jgi:hypothetical protein